MNNIENFFNKFTSTWFFLYTAIIGALSFFLICSIYAIGIIEYFSKTFLQKPTEIIDLTGANDINILEAFRNILMAQSFMISFASIFGIIILILLVKCANNKAIKINIFFILALYEIIIFAALKFLYAAILICYCLIPLVFLLYIFPCTILIPFEFLDKIKPPKRTFPNKIIASICFTNGIVCIIGLIVSICYFFYLLLLL